MRLGRLRQPTEPPSDHLAHAFGDAEASIVPRYFQRSPSWKNTPVSPRWRITSPMKNGLPSVSRRICVRERHQGFVERVAGHRLDQSFHRRVVEAMQRHALHCGLASEIRQYRCQRMRARQIRIAIRPDHQEPHRLRPSRNHVLQEQQLRCSGPVEIVQDQNDRLLPATPSPAGPPPPRGERNRSVSASATFGAGTSAMRRASSGTSRASSPRWLAHVRGEHSSGASRRSTSGPRRSAGRQPHVLVAAPEQHHVPPTPCRRAASVASRVLPIPGSPAMSTTWRCPSCAFAHATASASASALRPNIAKAERAPITRRQRQPTSAGGSHSTAQETTGSGSPFAATGPIGLNLWPPRPRAVSRTRSAVRICPPFGRGAEPRRFDHR